jgi:hypothetical protein
MGIFLVCTGGRRHLLQSCRFAKIRTVKTILYEIVLRDTFYAFLHYKKQTLLSAYEMLLLRLFPYHVNYLYLSPLYCLLANEFTAVASRKST